MPPQVDQHSQSNHTSLAHNEYHSEDFASSEQSQFMDPHDSHYHQEDIYHIDDSEHHFENYTTSNHHSSNDDCYYHDTQGYDY